jgi:NADPH-dependent glutamate synthase beta subunit-like oxidoreductase
MFERLPAPFGLVRYGVAPDHPKIKSVTKVYDGIAANKRFRFFGNVEFGKHLKLDELKQYYHQILFATGAQTDRKMGIPGEDLDGSHTATELSLGTGIRIIGEPVDLAESAAIIGVGNVRSTCAHPSRTTAGLPRPVCRTMRSSNAARTRSKPCSDPDARTAQAVYKPRSEGSR